MAIPPEVDGTVRLVRRERPRADGPLIDGAKALFPGTTAVDRGGGAPVAFRARLRQFRELLPAGRHFRDRQPHQQRPGQERGNHRQEPDDPDHDQEDGPDRDAERYGVRGFVGLRPGSDPPAGAADAVPEGHPDRRLQHHHPQEQCPARPAAHRVHLSGDLPAVLLHAVADARRRLAGHELRQVPRQADHQGHAQDHVRRRGRGGRGDRGAPGDQGIPAEPGQVPGHRGQDPQGRAALRPARHR